MMKILYLEDSQDDAELLKSALQGDKRWQITVASTCAAAQQAFESESPDIIISDIHLPDCVGLTWIASLRNQGYKKPILVITGQDDNAQSVLAALKAGANDYLLKDAATYQNLPKLLARISQQEDIYAPFKQDTVHVLHAIADLQEGQTCTKVLQKQAPYIQVKTVHSWHSLSAHLKHQSQEPKYDLLLLDGDLPDANLLSLIRKIADMPCCQLLPWAVISNEDNAKLAKLVVSHGASAYLARNETFYQTLPILVESLITASRLRHKQQEYFLSEARYDRLIENLPDVVYRYEFKPTPHLQYISPAIETLTGYKPEDFLGAPDLLMDLVHPDDRKRLETAITTHQPALRLRWVTRDGHVIWTEQRNVSIYDENHQLIAIEGIARDITEAQNNHASLQRRLQELEIISQTGTLILEKNDPDEMIAGLIAIIGPTFYSEHCSVLLLTPDQKYFQAHPASRGISGKFLQDKFSVERGIIGRAIRERRSINVPDTRLVPDYLPATPNMLSEICVPVSAGGQIFGAINIESPQKNAFSASDERLLNIISEQLAAGLEKVRLLKEEQRRRLEVVSLQKAVAKMLTTLKLDEVLAAILDGLREVTHYTSASLWLKKGTAFHLLAQRGLSEKISRVITPQNKNPLSLELAKTQQAIVLADVQTDPRFQQWDEGIAPIRSWMGLPLIKQGQFIGYIACDHSEPNRFTEADAQKATAFAQQAAIAIDRAQIYEQTLQTIQRLSILHQTSQDILAAGQDAESLYQAIHRAAAQLMPCDAFSIVLKDEDNPDALQAVYLTDAGKRYPGVRVSSETSLSSHILKSGKPLLLDDLHKSPVTGHHFGEKRQVKSSISIPIKIETETFGVLHVQSYQLNAYDEDDLRLLEMLASYAAIGLTNKKLLAEKNRHLREAQAIQAIQNMLLDTQHLNDMLEKVLRRVIEISEPAEKGSLLLLDEASRLHIEIAVGYPDEILDIVFEPGEGYAQKCIAQKQGLVFQHIDTQHPEYTKNYNEDVKAIKSAVAVPLIAHNRPIGAISLDNTNDPEAFNASHITLLQTIAPSLALAIENHRLLNESRQRLQETGHINAALSLLQQANTPAEVLNKILALWHDIFQIEAGIFFEKPYSAQDWRLCAFWGAHEQILQSENLPDLLASLTASHEHTEAAYQTIQQDSHAGQYFLAAAIQDMRYPTAFIVMRQTPFEHADLQLFGTINEILHNALTRTNLNQRTRQQVALLSSMRDINTALLGSFNIEIIFNMIINHLETNLAPDAVMLWKAEEVSQYLHLAGQRGAIRGGTPTHLRYGTGLAGKIALARRTQQQEIPNPDEKVYPDLASLASRVSWHIGVPMMAKGHLKGVLTVHYADEITLTFEQEDYLRTLAGQAALALDAMELLKKTQQANQELFNAYDNILRSWGMLMEARGIEPEGHTARVTALTLKIAQKYGVKGKNLLHIKQGAWLHDIGKLAIPDAIWNKAGALTPEERQQVEMHPVRALEILKTMPALRAAQAIPYAHHENWDGSGYPRHLAGDTIPLEARIFALADVWDTVQSPRPYAPIWTRDEALDYIKSQSGKKFDPKLVTLFLEMVSQGQI